MKTGKYFIAHYSKESGFRYLVLRNPVDERGYYWSDKKMKDLVNNPDDIQFLFESRQKAVQVLHDLGITQKCKIVKYNHSSRKYQSNTSSVTMKNFTYEELLEILLALDTKIIHIEKTDKCNLNRLDKLYSLKEKVINAMKQIKE